MVGGVDDVVGGRAGRVSVGVVPEVVGLSPGQFRVVPRTGLEGASHLFLPHGQAEGA